MQASIHPLIYYPATTDLVFHVSSIKWRLPASCLHVACVERREGRRKEGNRGRGKLIGCLVTRKEREGGREEVGERTTKAE